MPGAFYFHMTIKTEDNTSLSFWYPDQILQAGHKYIFTVLPAIGDGWKSHPTPDGAADPAPRAGQNFEP
jgi:hypothetical protein